MRKRDIPRVKHTLSISELTESSAQVWRFGEDYQTIQIKETTITRLSLKDSAFYWS